jgi:hypothetical protein
MKGSRMGHRFSRRLPDGRFGNVANPGSKPSDDFDWDRAIASLRNMLNDMDAKQGKRTCP